MSDAIAVWKRRALTLCGRDPDQALAALIADLRTYNAAAAIAARDDLSHTLFHRRLSPAAMREFILGFLPESSGDGRLNACHENPPGDIGRAA